MTGDTRSPADRHDSIESLITARRFAEGATEAERVELTPDLVAASDDRQLVWIDVEAASYRLRWPSSLA
jgi:hypothetical protein